MLLYALTTIPPLLFILLLIWLDSFSLVKKGRVAIMFVCGMISVVGAIYGNHYLSFIIPFSLIVAPICEEFLKGSFALAVVARRKSNFFIDSAIYGAAVGAGFAFAENIYYVVNIPDMLIGTAIIRGFSTAIMHCGATATTAVILNWLVEHKRSPILYFPIALIPAILLHSLYNSLIFPPVVMLLTMLIGVTGVMVALFMYNEHTIGKWLDMEMASEVELLAAMNNGEFTKSNAGDYMLTLKSEFEPMVFFDMFCYVKLYLELSLISKRNLMLIEQGFTPPLSEDTSSKLTEFRTLESSLGFIALSALKPLVKKGRKEDWKMGLLQ